MSKLIEWLTGKDPLLETKAFLMIWAGEDPQRKKAAEIAMYGVGSTLGVDASRRATTFPSGVVIRVLLPSESQAYQFTTAWKPSVMEVIEPKPSA